MRETLIIKQGPATEPLSKETLAEHCRISIDDDDDLLVMYGQTARDLIEKATARSLINQQFTWTVTPEHPIWLRDQRFRGPLRLPVAPVVTVDAVRILDTLGNATAVPAATTPLPSLSEWSGWVADTAQEPAWLRIGRATILVDGRALSGVQVEHIQIDFTAGYGTDASLIPPQLLQALMMQTAWLYENRGDAEGTMPAVVRALTWNHRLLVLG